MNRVGDGERDQLLDRLVAAFTVVRTGIGLKHNELAHLGIGQAGFMVLSHLALHGPSKMSETAAALRVTSASITGIATTLVRDGYIRRLAEPHDRRVVRVEITDSGRQKLSEVRKSRQERAGSVLTRVSDDDLRELVELIERLSLTIARTGQGGPDNTGDVEVSL